MNFRKCRFWANDYYLSTNNEITPKSFGESLGKKKEKTNPKAKSVFMVNTILLKKDSFFTI